MKIPNYNCIFVKPFPGGISYVCFSILNEWNTYIEINDFLDGDPHQNQIT